MSRASCGVGAPVADISACGRWPQAASSVASVPAAIAMNIECGVRMVDHSLRTVSAMADREKLLQGSREDYPPLGVQPARELGRIHAGGTMALHGIAAFPSRSSAHGHFAGAAPPPPRR